MHFHFIWLNGFLKASHRAKVHFHMKRVTGEGPELRWTV